MIYRTKLIIIGFLTFSLLIVAMSSMLYASEQRLTLPYGAPIPIEMARKAAVAAIAEGKRNNWDIAVAVVDAGGSLVYFERIDGTQTGSINLAIEKAQTAAAYKRSTKMLEERVAAGRLQYLRQSGSIPIEGGLPLIVDGKIAGGIGVSGVRSEQDGICAKAGVDVLTPATPIQK